MMPRTVLKLVLLVSCAHALVHAYELVLPSVEQGIAAEFFGSDISGGKLLTGRLSNAWRLMWGLGAVLAGLLVDRFGARRLLAIYLLGCAAACAAAALSTAQATLFLAMLFMGAMASIYHPAGLALISHETNAGNRTLALSVHGVFGSAGIGFAPLLVGMLLIGGLDWRGVYWVMLAPGLLLGSVFAWQALRRAPVTAVRSETAAEQTEQEHSDWPAFFTLTVMASLQGFVYSALVSFLPRYLAQSGLFSWDSQGNFLTSGVLLLGCIGQVLAGTLARPAILERQLALITYGNVPFLAWMAFAEGWERPLAAGMLAMVHFMHQPIYNSLVAKYTPRLRRSLCYGFSFAMAFGLGSFGASFAGASENDMLVYGTLACIAAAAGIMCTALWLWHRPLNRVG